VEKSVGVQLPLYPQNCCCRSEAGVDSNSPVRGVCTIQRGNLDVEVTVQSLSDVSREIEITATLADLAPHFDKAYQEYRRKIEIRGFRKGKAPLDLVKKLYGDLIENDSLGHIATELYKHAVTEKELKPIGEPLLVDMDYKRGVSFRCKIQYDIRPQILVKEYKGISAEKVVHTLTDDEVEKEILRLRRINATMEEVDAVTDAEHIVTADLQEIDDTGIPIIGKKSENIRFYLADEQLEQPFKDALNEARKGGEYKVQSDHRHGEQSHAVNTQVTVKKVEKVTLPEFDDAFAARITKEKIRTTDALRADIRENLEAYWKQRSERHLINSLIAEIIRRHDFQVPESLIRSVLEGLLEEVKNEYPTKRLPDDFDVNKFNEENRAYAVYQAKWALLREELIKAENITISDKDLESLAEKESLKIKIPKDRLVNYYKSSEQIKDRLIGDKLLKLLVDSAIIKEVPEKM
jgi:trigger factor